MGILGSPGTPYYGVENRFLGNAVFAGMRPNNYEYAYAPGNKCVSRGVCCSADSIVTTDQRTAADVAPPLIATQTGTCYYFGGKMIKKTGGAIPADANKAGQSAKISRTVRNSCS